MERYERDFKGVWIPREIWLSRELSLMEKVLFVEIHSLDNERGCFAGNKHFADFFNVSERQIRTYLSSLKEKGFISISVRNFNERVIRTVGKYRRIPNAALVQLNGSHAALVRRMSVNRPRRAEENFRGGRK